MNNENAEYGMLSAELRRIFSTEKINIHSEFLTPNSAFIYEVRVNDIHGQLRNYPSRKRGNCNHN